MSESDTDRRRRRITLERRYGATVEEVWDLWTTKEGIEAWWGPDGFSVTVRPLDLRPGGALRYTMTATDPAQVTFMEQAGMPIATDSLIVYKVIEPMRLLGYTSTADFIPGVDPYEVDTTVSFETAADGVRMVLTFDAMHDEQWTERAVKGHESELGRLESIMGANR